MEQFCKEQFWENAMKTLVRSFIVIRMRKTVYGRTCILMI